MTDIEKKVKRLLKLPALVNWVRHNKRRLDDTVFQLREFSKSPPMHSLAPVQKICANLAYGRISVSDAMETADTINRVIVKSAAKEIIPEFYKYLIDSDIQGVPELDGFYAMYIIGKQPNGEPLLVPVKPTFIGVKNNVLTPVFLIPWASLNLDNFQQYLLSTIVCDSVLTQQDYRQSDAEIVALPRIKGSKVRYRRSWRARDYNMLSKSDLSEQFERYSKALSVVIQEIRQG